jgi:hypothetical protein
MPAMRERVRSVMAEAMPNMMEAFPERPKGMHHDTYMRLFWEHYEAEWEHLVSPREELTSSSSRYSRGKFVRQFLARKPRRRRIPRQLGFRCGVFSETRLPLLPLLSR